MLLRNLDISSRLTNGTKLAILHISTYTLTVRNLADNELHYLPRITCKFLTFQGISVKRIQFPIKVCYAVTIHRAQDQTLDRVLIDLRRDSFTHGCLYVALSRVRNSHSLRTLTTPTRITEEGWARTANVVYRSLLSP